VRTLEGMAFAEGVARQGRQECRPPIQYIGWHGLDLDPNVNFWTQPFGVDSVTDEAAHTCPAAVADRLTICVMPR
jgi:hypothetical protein